MRKNIALSDSGFVFNPSTGDSYSVNPIGLFIIQQLQKGKSDKEIVEGLLKDYLTDKATVEKDLYDFTQMLQTYKITE